MLKESDEIDVLEVTYDSQMIYEKHHRSVSIAASKKAWYLEEVLANIQ